MATGVKQEGTPWRAQGDQLVGEGRRATAGRLAWAVKDTVRGEAVLEGPMDPKVPCGYPGALGEDCPAFHQKRWVEDMGLG